MKAVAWSFFGIRKTASTRTTWTSSIRCISSSRRIVGVALFVGALVAAGATGCCSGVREAGTAPQQEFRNQEIKMSVRRNRRRALLLRARAVAPSGDGRVRAVLRHLRRRPVDQRRTTGASTSLLFGLHPAGPVPAVPVVRRRHRRERGRAVQPPHRPLVPLEHELVHLLRGDVLRRLLRRAVLVRARIRCRRWAAWTTPAVARLQGRLAERGGRRHRFAGGHRRAVPRPWGRSRSRPSTPRCC